MAFDVRTLHEIERKIIKALTDGKLTEDDLTQKTGLNIDQVRRGVQWLLHKNLVIESKKHVVLLELGDEGKEVLKDLSKSPERRLIATFPPGKTFITFAEAKTKSGLSKEEFTTAYSIANRKGRIVPEGNGMRLTSTTLDEEDKEAKALKELEEKQKIVYDSLPEEKRKVYDSLSEKGERVKKYPKITSEITLSTFGASIFDDIMKLSETERTLDVTASAPVIYTGRKHPLQDVVDEVREVFVGLGFEEIEGPIVQNSFWNFDALFTPQDHPAREMQDTFYIANMKAGNVADKKIVNSVTNIHQQGWNYKWNINEARKLVLRTHTTPVTIRYLADNRPEEARVFSVGRVFRNEKLTYKHLAEFYQVEGIVVGKNVTLRDLMGLQTEFYAKMGLNKVKFWPSFFPYTEPSLQSMVYHEKLGKWVELFGMGIFRPEVTLPVGVKNPVLAWGGGLERIAMLRYGLDDVRELYNNRLSWLRSVPKCQ